MSEARKQSMVILSQVAEFLANLPEDQLDDLQSGAARLTLIPANSDKPLQPASRPTSTRVTRERAAAPDLAKITELLATIDSRDAAAALLKPLKLPELKELAQALEIQVAGPKDKIASAIVERMVGSRLDSLAIRGTATLPY